MTVKVTKDAINLREKLAELDKPSGITGEAILRSDVPADAREVLGIDNFEQITVSTDGVITADGLTVDTDTLYVDAANNRVGMGTTSPSATLDVENSAVGVIAEFRSNTPNGQKVTLNSTSTGFQIASGFDTGISGSFDIRSSGGNSYITMSPTGTEAMRIDSSGNLLVGTTTVNASGSNVAGVTAQADGRLDVSSTLEPLDVNRISTDGTIAQFRKEGTVVGSIGTYSGAIDLAGSTRGIRLTGSSFFPVTNAGSVSDNTTNLGYSAGRFKDLYLSGGVYLGGTGAANKLDDYETGTFTPSLEGASTAGTYELASVSGVYTKIGRQITIHVAMTLDSVITGGGSGYARIRGLPVNYDASENPGAHGVVYFSGVNYDASASYITVARSSGSDSNTLLFNEIIPNAASQLVDISDFAAGDVIQFSYTYNAV